MYIQCDFYKNVHKVFVTLNKCVAARFNSSFLLPVAHLLSVYSRRKARF